MRKLIAVALVGLGSAVAFADSGDNPEGGGQKKEKVEFKCRFEGCRRGDFKNPDEGRTVCWVEGSLCGDHKDKHCSEDDNRLEIKCSNGFELRSKDIATSKSDHALWLNADSDHHDDDDRKIATIRVEELLGDSRGHDHDEFDRQATLLVSKGRHEIRDQLGDASRLEGECKFEIKHE